MPRPIVSLLTLTAGLALAACDGSGEHNVPDEANQAQTQADSMQSGTNVAVPPPVGTVNPAAPSGPGTDPNADSTTQGANALGGPMQSRATGPTGTVSPQSTADTANRQP